MGFIVPKPPMPLRRFASILRGRARSRTPNIQNVPRTTHSTTSTTSTFHPPASEERGAWRQTCEVARNLSFSTRDAVQAIRALGQAGVSAGRAGRQFQEALRNTGNLMSGSYDMGYVDRILITMQDGNEHTIENPRVRVYVDQEVVEHYSSSRSRPDRRVVVHEETRVEVGTDQNQFFDTIRLIRED